MKQILLLIIVFVFSQNAFSLESYYIEQIQGAWWSDHDNATADFLIQGNEVWLDIDADFHPCEIIGDILIFHLNNDLGRVENRIISISGVRLVLKNLTTQNENVYTREKRY